VDTAPPSPVERLLALAEAGGSDGPTLAALAADLEAALSASADRAAAAAAAAGELEAAVKGGKDQLLRLNAEFQNFRNRSEREKGEVGDRVKGQVLEELIPIIDNFEAAKQYIKPESDGEKKIESNYQALYKQMVDTFKKMGIEAVPTVGKAFDPAVHEAIARQPSADVTEDTVVQEFRKGFKVGGRLIRPATVAVAVPLEEGATPVAEEAGEGVSVEDA
jgi:molecular chaperone GrpE